MSEEKFAKNRKRQIICLVFFAAIYLTPFIARRGYIVVGELSFTFLIIPVVLVTIRMGLPAGLFSGACFGLSSMIAAYGPNATGMDELFRNPGLAVLPRLLIPVVVWFVFRCVRRIADDHTLSARLICGGFATLCGVVANTVFVIFTLVIFFPEEIGATDGISANALIISSILGKNLLIETLISVSVVCIYILVREKVLRKNVPEENEAPAIRKTFQKWLLFCSVVTFLITLNFLHHIISFEDIGYYQELLTERAEDILHLAEVSSDGVRNSDLEIGKTGIGFLLKNSIVIHSNEEEYIGKRLIELDVLSFGSDGEITYSTFDGASGQSILKSRGDYSVILFIPHSEILRKKNRMSAFMLSGLLILFTIIYLIVSKMVKHGVVEKIETINASLSRIREGNLEETVDVKGNAEFEELSTGINTTVETLKNTMDEITERNRQEKEFARAVQYAALPDPKTVRPQNGEYDVAASMNTAEEVGGDFYDFYKLDDGRLGFVIADVSGKGIPAALFMMTSKTLLRDLIRTGKDPAEAMVIANNQLSENNEQGMFVTAWLGILDLEKEEIIFSNAGHNPPLLVRNGEEPIYMDHKKYKRSLILGFMPGTAYQNDRITFSKGDMLYLYTDGVTEAKSPDGEFYGEERLKKVIDSGRSLEIQEILRAVQKDMDGFVGKADQFDDITMLVLRR